MVSEGDVYVNGNKLDQDFLPEPVYTSPGDYMQEGIERVVPDGQYLCFGDNRPNSRDGREFGPINRKLIVGKAFMKYWPISAVEMVPKVSF